MNSDHLVSIIMPAHNADPYIGEAIDSVIAQTHRNWELIVVVDGSNDRTAELVKGYQDERIRCMVLEEKKGVSSARNHGLEKAKGDFLLFFDADDLLFPKSLEIRLERFHADSDLAFVDGKVLITGERTDDIRSTWMPSFEGYPRKELLALKDTCFVTITWLIRTEAIGGARFDEGLTHCEDLDFYLSIADQGMYSYVEEPIMAFRRTGRSAMSDLVGLEKGYRRLVAKWGMDERVGNELKTSMKKKARRILFRSYLKKGAFLRALKCRFGWG